MLATLLRLTGLDSRLAELKRSLEQQAEAAVDYGKSLAVHLALSAGLVLTAMILLLFAILIGLLALYVWAESRWGTYPALALIGGLFVAGAIAALLGGLWAARSTPKLAEIKPGIAPAAASTASPDPPRLFPETNAARGAEPTELDPFLYMLGRYAQMPKTGVGLIDDLLLQAGPRVEVVANDVVRRATTLVREGDRKTMLTILGAAAALGWLIVRSSERSSGSDRS
jgi:hypothetical protein